MACTYDTATDRGKVRLLIADTDIAKVAFQDGEVDVVLELWTNNVRLAAAELLDIMASNKSKLAIRLSRGDMGEDMTTLPKALREQAQRLRDNEKLSRAEAGDDVLEATVSPSLDIPSYARNIYWERESEVT